MRGIFTYLSWFSYTALTLTLTRNSVFGSVSVARTISVTLSVVTGHTGQDRGARARREPRGRSEYCVANRCNRICPIAVNPEGMKVSRCPERLPR